MKRIKRNKRVKVKLTLPTDLPWKIFGALLGDLGVEPADEPEIYGALRNRDISGLMTQIASFEPRSILEEIDSDKSSAHLFFVKYQLGAFLKKYPFQGVDTKAPAIQKFVDAEQTCALYNRENYMGLVALDANHPDYLGILDEMRSDIEKLLGSRPPINSIMSHAKHGPGVSLGDSYKNGKSTEYFKWANLPYTVTVGTLPYAKEAIYADPRWIGAIDNWYRKKHAVPIGSPIDTSALWEDVFEVVDGSRITTVPKTAVSDRTIAIEPLLNCYLQLGVDHILKNRLRKVWGYDLTQQLRNQMLAEEGSVTDELVTVDLKAASDTISLKICEMLLPLEWYNLLLDFRAPVGALEGTVYSFEKISSMGNGFTFALESLIFGALVRCAIRRTKSVRKSAVYGDDLIVPSTAFSYLQVLLEMSGFDLNIDKSFSSGPFRESCGRDFFLGYDVRPLFLKRRVQNVQDLFYIHNSLVALQERLHWTWGVEFSTTIALILKYIPMSITRQYFGPKTESLDTHLFSSEVLRRNSQGERFYYAIITKARKFNKGSDFYFRKLMNQLKGNSQPLITLRGTPTSENRWDTKKRLNTGNAFDITKRGSVLYVSTRIRIP